MSLSHPLRIIISEGRRKSKTVKKFTLSPKNKSPKAAQPTHSPFKQNKIRFERMEKPHTPIIFDYTIMTNKNYKKMLNIYKEQRAAHVKAHEKHGLTGYSFEYEGDSVQSKLDYKRSKLNSIHNQLIKLHAILKIKAQNKKKSGKKLI